jgi:ubiquinol-cytochrome c reductase cytochrome c subunit
MAATLGTFVLGRSHVTASSPLMENPGFRLSASVTATQKAQLAEGQTLFTETCAACHGGQAQGSSLAPALLGLGSGEIDLWLTAGWMPLRTPENQAEIKPVWFARRSQINAVIAYIASLRSGGFGIPSIDLSNSNVAQGFDLFSLNCAPCHTITGAGDALANGYHADSLHGIAATQVLEAIRTGPQNMPKFSVNQMSNQEALNLVAFVTKNLEHPDNVGGVGLGGVGPVAEGFVGLFVGVGICLLAAYWVGDRTERDDESGHGHGEGEDGGDGGHGGDDHNQDSAEGVGASGDGAEREVETADV